MKNKTYVILIGSVARDDFETESDIDICRINNFNNIEKLPFWPNGPISYIDYEFTDFMHLYNLGSLFIFHMFREGTLLLGNNSDWNKLKFNFKVQQNFHEELLNIKNITEIFKNIEIFGGKYLSMYSNFYTLIKNFSIFFLADNKIYNFNKKKAISAVFGETYIDILIDSYNYFERGIVNTKWDYGNKEQAKKIVEYYLVKMEEILK
ncbi:MAG: hypothetical protein K6T94_14920 [Paenibacillus sp.]|nr:hypothetical protein [Paenibacillus sp.]